MLISPALHFEDQSLMTKVQRFQCTLPAEDFWVRAVPLPVTCQNDPDRMQFPMLTQEVCPAKTMWIDIPDSHGCIRGRSFKIEVRQEASAFPSSISLICEPRHPVCCCLMIRES